MPRVITIFGRYFWNVIFHQINNNGLYSEKSLQWIWTRPFKVHFKYCTALSTTLTVLHCQLTNFTALSTTHCTTLSTTHCTHCTALSVNYTLYCTVNWTLYYTVNYALYCTTLSITHTLYILYYTVNYTHCTHYTALSTCTGPSTVHS